MTCRVGGMPEIRQYWDLDYPDKVSLPSVMLMVTSFQYVLLMLSQRSPDPRTETEMISSVRSHLIEAVQLRLRADVPIGIYLSGGIDSSALAGIAAHLVKEGGATMGSEKASDRVCCFSIGFDSASGFDESGEWAGYWTSQIFLVRPSESSSCHLFPVPFTHFVPNCLLYSRAAKTMLSLMKRTILE